MNINKIRKVFYKYPKVLKLGYSIAKSIWRIEAMYKDYDYPNDESLATIDKNTVKEYNKNRILGPKKRICYAAFNNLHFTMNGDVYSCCYSSGMYLGNIRNNSIKEIWKSENVNNAQTFLSNYNMSKCLSCKEVLTARNYGSFPGLKYDMYSKDTAFMPTQMSFELSDLCNFACVMCNEDYSSTIKKIKGIPLNKNFYTDTFLNQLEEFIPYLKIATFIGGEPMMIKIYYKIWERIIKLNPNCIIHVQTNGSILNEQFISFINSGNFEIGISIDSLQKSTFENIRKNSNFDIVRSNLNTYLKFHQQGKIILSINFCPIILNWKEIPEVVNFANANNISIKIIHVTRPRQLAIIYRSVSYLQNVVRFLNNIALEQYNSPISNVNNRIYDDFRNILQFYIEDGLKREDFITVRMRLAIAEIYDQLKIEIIRHSRIEFNETDLQNLFDTLNQTLQFEPMNIKKRVVISVLYILRTSDVQKSSMEVNREILTEIKLFMKIVEEQLQIEKGVFDE